MANQMCINVGNYLRTKSEQCRQEKQKLQDMDIYNASKLMLLLCNDLQMYELVFLQSQPFQN